MRNLLVVLPLLSITGAVSAVCQTPIKSAFSLSIRAHEPEVASGHRIELQITKTNLSDHALLVGADRIAFYTFDVRCNHLLVPETEQAKSLRAIPGPMINGNLPPHGWAVDTAAVNEFRDMR